MKEKMTRKSGMATS
eukprot:IDg20700t1